MLPSLHLPESVQKLAQEHGEPQGSRKEEVNPRKDLEVLARGANRVSNRAGKIRGLAGSVNQRPYRTDRSHSDHRT